jgi:hypothetical protein
MALPGGGVRLYTTGGSDFVVQLGKSCLLFEPDLNRVGEVDDSRDGDDDANDDGTAALNLAIDEVVKRLPHAATSPTSSSGGTAGSPRATHVSRVTRATAGRPKRLRRESRECPATRIHRCVTEFFFDTEQLVVFGDTFTSSRRTGLDLTAVRCHREVGDGGVFGFARAV